MTLSFENEYAAYVNSGNNRNSLMLYSITSFNKAPLKKVHKVTKFDIWIIDNIQITESKINVNL